MKKIAIVYWSGTGNTEIMANGIAEGVKESGAEVSVFTASEFSSKMVADYDKLAFGCPAMGAEVLEESEFEPMFTSIEKILSGKEIALFGSYGWGDGEWMRSWQQHCTDLGIIVFSDEGFMINEAPDAAGLTACKEFGKSFAS